MADVGSENFFFAKKISHFSALKKTYQSKYPSVKYTEILFFN